MLRLADRGASAVHAPGSNLVSAQGLAQVRQMMDHGVNVALATDAANTSDQLNMFERCVSASPSRPFFLPITRRWLGKRTLFTWRPRASRRPWASTGRIGRIEPGYKADLVFLD